ncbi:hypothetical protein QA635_34340 [Bradyrhizobium brasilense]|uniref:hypothetical protein n=1 Tax=Bradyrhizobium brasilense TaxID=1419277 RepID=UPI0024B0946F|nr:hypothetical protein [Bradyrhizobium australafricanum]WFU31551.1 hypothetical protein QA635_34340 [Bradyrhizobium australafricanum]
MNVDPRNPANTPLEAHDVGQQPHRVDRQPDEPSAHTDAPAHRSEDQASFEQRLDDLDSVNPASDSVSLMANPGTARSAPNEVATVPGRYPSISFVSARAKLAATLTGATLDALRHEIDLADQQSARWSPATATFDDSVDRDRIFDEVAGSSYVTLRRFQNQDSDSKPRTEVNTSAISHVRNTARDHSSVGDPLERYPMDLARLAGWHMRGKTTASPFVSLVEDPSKLVVSRDHWARAIANNASTLHTYTVPRSSVWTPDDVLSSIGLGMNVEDQDNIDADVDLMCSLGRAPTRETERLFLGGNLDDYRTARDANPYRRDSTE